MAKNHILSIEEKQKLVNALEEQVVDRISAAKAFAIPYSTACAIYNQALANGGIVPPRKPSVSKPKKLTEDLIKLLEDWLFEDCTLSDNDLCKKLEKETGLFVSRETIRQTLKAKPFYYTIKGTTSIVEARNTEALWTERQVFSKWFIDQENKKKLVFLGETGFKIEMRRGYGRSKRGVQAEIVVPRIKSTKISVIAALNSNGLLHYDEEEGYENPERFVWFLNNLFERLEPESILVMDNNVVVHKMTEVIQLIASRGHTYKFLPPSSPFLNPIVYFFNQWKYHVKAQRVQNDGELRLAIDAVKVKIDSAECENYVNHVSNNCVKILMGDRNVN